MCLLKKQKNKISLDVTLCVQHRDRRLLEISRDIQPCLTAEGSRVAEGGRLPFSSLQAFDPGGEWVITGPGLITGL